GVFALERSTGAVLWRYDAPAGDVCVTPYRRATAAHLGGPTLVGDRLALAGVDGSLALLDPETGTELERWPAGSLGSLPITGPVAAMGGQLFTIDLSGKVSAW